MHMQLIVNKWSLLSPADAAFKVCDLEHIDSFEFVNKS